MQDVANSGDLSKLFMRGRRDLECFIIFLAQNVFSKGSEAGTISLKTQYQVLFKNPSDELQVSVLAHQLLPSQSKHFIDRNATFRPSLWLFVL